MSILNKMEVFYFVASLNSFSQAARELGLSKGYVSLQINELEKELKLKLLHRTTRHLSLTDAGKLFFVSCEKIIKEQKAARSMVEGLRSEPAGKLKISASPSICATILAQILPGYIARYPKINVEVESSAAVQDLDKHGIDIALRIARSPDERYVARLLTSFKFAICAAPHYLEKAREIKQPRDLLNHNCLIYAADPQGAHWTFDRDNQAEEVTVNGSLASNNITLIMEATLAGLGVTRIPDYVLSEEKIKSRLTILFAEYTQTTMPIYAIYPSMIYGSPKIESFLTYCREHFAAK